MAAELDVVSQGILDATPAKKPARKAKAKKAKTAAKAKAKPSANGKAGPTVRERVFRLLAKTPCTGPEVKAKLGLSGVPSLLKDEGVRQVPRIKREVAEGVRGVVYSLTAAGRRDLEAGKVDASAAEPSGGKDWPGSR
jgi:hypothetical protein